MLLDGERKKYIMPNNDQSYLECRWEGDSTYAYRLVLSTTLQGKGFSIYPDSLRIVPSSSTISMIPVKEKGKSFGQSAQTYTSYELFGKKEKVVKQMFDIIYKTKIDNDTVSFYMIPSNYILYKNDPVINDTIKITFQKTE